MGTRLIRQLAGAGIAMAMLSGAAYAEGDRPVQVTSLATTQEHVILEASSAQALQLSKDFPGRLRKRAEGTTAFQLNNITIEPFAAPIVDKAEESEVIPAGRWQPLATDPPTDPALVTAPRPDRAQDLPGGTVAAGSPPAATGDSLKCGAKTAKTLTVCLNRERRLDALDRLALLAFTREPCIAYVDSDSERAVLVAALGDAPSRMEIASMQLRIASSAGTTTGRIHLVRKSP